MRDKEFSNVRISPSSISRAAVSRYDSHMFCAIGLIIPGRNIGTCFTHSTDSFSVISHA